MPDDQRVEAARSVLTVLPLVMRSVGISMREGGGDVSPVQHRLLVHIAARARTPRQIAAMHGVTPATATTLITTLESRGWVSRDRDAEDRRRVLVSITPEGRAALATAQRVAEQGVAEMLETLDDSELRTVRAGLSLLETAGNRAKENHPTKKGACSQ